MKPIAFIIPYFGKFNNYFQLFLNSCAHNSEYEWIIFTDDKREFDYPDNVHVHYCEFSDIQNLIQSKFEFEISLKRPYKLCDFKPAYGYIFSEYISDYKFWGHCDTDMIWGRISDFITEEDLECYDKIGILGHCTIYRNHNLVNKVFLNTLHGEYRAKQVYSEEWNHSFDEEFNDSVNNIFEEYGLRIDYREHEANIYTKSSNFKITRLELDTKNYRVEKKSRSFFVWDNGEVFRYKMVDGSIVSEKYLYLHMQSRPMKIRNTNNSRYKIIPNAFEDMEIGMVTLENFKSIKIKNINLHYFKLRTHNLFDKLKKCYKKYIRNG